MAEQIISPGVFTRENDLSFLPQGVGQIGAAIIGPTDQGPAFIPTVVRSFSDFETRFGGMSEDTYVPQAVREYLRNAGSVTVCRILGGSGYTLGTTSSALALIATGSTSTNRVLLGLLYPSKCTAGDPDLGDSTITNTNTNDLGGNVTIVLNGTNSTSTSVVGSINPGATNNFFNKIGNSPDNSKSGTDTFDASGGYPGYTYLNFKTLTTKFIAEGASTGLTGYGFGTQKSLGYGGMYSGSYLHIESQSGNTVYDGGAIADEKYGFASTPMIQSQKSLGQIDLFQIHTLDHGKEMARKYKVSVANLKEPGDIDGEQQYSTFSVIIRKVDDKDKSPFILEQFNNVNLNPDSPNYISRAIGDRYPQYNQTLKKVELLGNYPNQSRYIRVSVSEPVNAGSISPKISPKGFAAVTDPIKLNVWSGGNILFPSASYEGVQTTTDSSTSPVTYNALGYLGYKFQDKEPDNLNWLRPTPSGGTANKVGAFSVDDHYGHPSSSLWSGSLSQSLDSTGVTGPSNTQLKFSIPFQGGDDGLAPWTIKKTGANIAANNLYGFDLSTSTAAGYKAYKKALDILSNQDEYDINMLAMPGVIHKLHPLVTNAGIDLCEERGDTFFVMDLNQVDRTVIQAVSDASGLDTNYAAVYYPWVKVLDPSKNKPVLVPPSVIFPGAIAASDRIGAEWFAPAGLNRGVLGNVMEAKVRLNQAERDTLYNAKINPIATFPQTGVCIWGQKTLQERSTALDRINVRRLLITLKKFIASSSKYLVFEQNTLQTRVRFLNIVNPYLESIQQQQGLFAFRVVMDESNNTPDVIDRNQLVGAIYLQPAKTAEFIILDFNVLPTGATFPS